jgi:hypothetical protein
MWSGYAEIVWRADPVFGGTRVGAASGRPPKLVVTFSPKATDGELEAVAARLNALEHPTDVTVNEV